MTAAGTPGSPRTTTEAGQGTGTATAGADRLTAAARELAGAAAAVRAAGVAVTAVASDPALLASLGRSPRRGLRAAGALARSLTDPAGLGHAPDGGRAGRAARAAGVAARRGSLATDLAATALRLQVRLCATRQAEYAAESAVRRMLVAVEAGLPALALRILREDVRVRSAGHALAALAPTWEAVTAWHALTDANPFNDAAAWLTVTGAGAESSRGHVPAPRSRRRTRSAGESPEAVFPDGLDEGGGISAHLRNLAALGPGRMLTRQVTGPDGTTRCLVLLPGPEFVLPRTASPEGLVAAVAALGRGDCPYTLAARDALRLAVPDGMPVALVGHGPGGVAALHLAGGPGRLRRAAELVVTAGSPAGSGLPPALRARVVRLAEEHDLMPRLEGRSPLPVPVPSPSPERLELSWTDPSYDVPQCHGAQEYAQSLDKTATEARDRVDELLAPYRGRPGATAVHRLTGG
ncbi:hypothetical protein ACSNOH_10610 [Streptomyces sp. URMC 127]|uniref:hypothetical protein n=1 Tax=Streptomyces sp. URMC 127 TaxID=3423402 RepID=UPI003F1A3B6D